jgi:hypothetical protein
MMVGAGCASLIGLGCAARRIQPPGPVGVWRLAEQMRPATLTTLAGAQDLRWQDGWILRHDDL